MKKLILLLISLLGLWYSFAEYDPAIIGCINMQTNETTKPHNWGCNKWPGWQNIMLPPESHWDVWLEVFNNNPRQIINRLPIVNMESGFNPEAENPHAIGYVQTLRRRNVWLSIEEQLTWMRDRQEYQLQKYIHWQTWRIPACWYYWENDNNRDWFEAGEDGVMSCLYRRHYDANRWSWYAKRAMALREYYYEWFHRNPINWENFEFNI